MNSISPVFTENEVENERVIALDQPEYEPIIILPIKYDDGVEGMVVRFTFSDAERELIARGADLIIAEPCFRTFMPLAISIAMPNERPENW